MLRKEIETEVAEYVEKHHGEVAEGGRRCSCATTIRSRAQPGDRSRHAADERAASRRTLPRRVQSDRWLASDSSACGPRRSTRTFASGTNAPLSSECVANQGSRGIHRDRLSSRIAGWLSSTKCISRQTRGASVGVPNDNSISSRNRPFRRIANAALDSTQDAFTPPHSFGSADLMLTSMGP